MWFRKINSNRKTSETKKAAFGGFFSSSAEVIPKHIEPTVVNNFVVTSVNTIDSVSSGLISGNSLYAFIDASFSAGSVSGTNGPSIAQARAGLTGIGVAVWKDNTSYFNVTAGIQYWTVPSNGTYRIEAWGAQGGTSASLTYNGGLGARMQGDFTLNSGEIVRILVGQQGIGTYGGGGGGTFVVRAPYNTDASILLIAGGGNPISAWSSVVSHGTTSTTGQTSSAYAGGSNGNGGTSNAGAYGGAGFSGNALGTDTCSATRPLAFINGGSGGAGAGGNVGGFGGGSATDSQCYGASGAGGGYSGGGGTSSSSQFGGGGGSYNSGTNQSNANGGTGTATRSGVNSGQVIITKL